MKALTSITVVLLTCFGIQKAQGQKTVNDISKVFTDYTAALTQNAKKDGKAANEVQRFTYNPKMLNMFIANNISTYLASSKDISLQKYYAVLESGDGVLFVGYNFMFRPNKLERLKNIFNAGVKTDVTDNFSSLINDGNINNKLGINLKHTHIFRGKIFYYDSQKKIVEDYRNQYLKKKYTEDLAKFSSAEVAANSDENTELETKIKYVTTLTAAEKNKMIETEYDAQYEKIATDEEKFITDHKLYNSIVSQWVTTEVYVPLGMQKYAISPATTVFATTDEKFYDFKASLFYTVMKKDSDKKTLYFSTGLSAYKNNNILTKTLKAYKFETIAGQGGANQTVADTKDAYVGVYTAGFSSSIKSELIYFFVQDIVGVSVAGEIIAGSFSARNWKLAIPVSLKDKDGKPSVNLELQFKEVYKAHSFGIGVGYAFGRYFK